MRGAGHASTLDWGREMSRITGQCALVTGASAGIGAACARRLAAEGVNLALWARRGDRLQALQTELVDHDVSVRIAEVDVRDRDAVFTAAESLAADGVEIDILINNAGLASGFGPIQTGDTKDWDRMIETNVSGLLYVTRAIVSGMVRRNRGHIVNIGSMAGRWVYPNGNVYNATKFAVAALNEAMSIDLVDTDIRVSAVNPAYVIETEFAEVRYRGDATRAAAVYEGYDPLTATDVADAVDYVLNTPPHVNVFEMLVLPAALRNGVTIRRRPR
jgi:3-hydroxy acid dehydrogenase / malonic semialdehyde reductase